MFLQFALRKKRGKRETAKPRFLVLRRRTLTVGAALLAAAAIFGAVNAPAAVRASAATRQLPIYCVERDQKVCSISFDAAWGADNTQKILDVLADYGVKCTFFVVGNWADQYPEQAKAIVESGNELMNHSNAHDHYNSLTADRIIADVNTCNDKIEALTGVRPTLIRCPFGEYDDHVISAIRSIGMEPIQWDVDSLDWKGISAGEITKRVTGKVTNGSIVLFHNAGEHTPELSFYYKNNLFKSCKISIINRKINNNMSIFIYWINLFHSTVTASHSGCHNYKYRFLHILYTS